MGGQRACDLEGKIGAKCFRIRNTVCSSHVCALDQPDDVGHVTLGNLCSVLIHLQIVRIFLFVPWSMRV